MPRLSSTTQTSYTSSSTSSRLDLRAPLFAIRKGTGIGRLRVIILVLADAVFISIGWLVAEILGTPIDSLWRIQDNPLSLIAILTTSISLIALQGLYKPGDKRRDYFSLFKALTFAQFLLVLVAFLYKPGYFVSRSTFALAWLLSVSLTLTGRLFLDIALNRIRAKGAGRAPIFLICDQKNRENIFNLINQENCYKIVGFADASSLDRNKRQATLETINRLGVTEVFVAWDAIHKRMFIYWLFRSAGIKLNVLPIDFKPIYQKLELTLIGRIPALKLDCPTITGTDFWIKRCFDFCFTTIFLLLASPLYLCIALLIKLDSPGPIFYQQTRIGLHGRPFKVWKFRTMVTNAEQLQKGLEVQNETKDGVLFKIKNDPRITQVGKILRKYSLDELPQLFNVLAGQMSLIGPRPLPTRDIEKFTPYHFIRHEVLPGVTGLWQVSGRSEILDFEEVIRLDVAYIENWSLGLDWQILLRTLYVVLGKKGAY